MLSNHSLPQLIPPRVRGALLRLQQEIWTHSVALTPEVTPAQPEQRPLSDAKKETRAPLAPNSFWGRLFDQRWCRLALPQPADGHTWLNWRDQAEATLYVDDKPFYGFNVAHRYCLLPKGVSEVWLQSTCVQSGIAHPDVKGMNPAGSFFEGAFLCRRNDEAWGAYHDVKCLLDVFMDQRHRESPEIGLVPRGFGLQPALLSIDPIYRRMLALMNEALDAGDQKGLGALREKMAEAYRELRAQDPYMKCVLTGHAHLDLVWIWPRRIGEIKAVNIFATANHLMDRYPEFRFAYSQPASYEAVQQREPGLYAQVQSRIASGQWQATGAMYVEADTTFACGEALARCFVLGQDGFKRLNGAPASLLWLPDVFGYSACLPQLMRLNGVDGFFTTKMTWNAVNRFPYSSFVWRGNDGSDVVAHVTQDAGYVTHMEVSDLKNPMRAHQQGETHREYLLPTGYGDGGGGPTDEMCERARRLGGLPGMPAVQWDQPEAFFERLKPLRDELPVYQGECYLEYHRGTFTTHGNLKAAFRNLERALFCAEAVSALSGKKLSLEAAWKLLVFSQFHDFIPGSSVWDVYLEELPRMDELADDALAQASSALGGQGELCLFNPHLHPVRRWVRPADGEKPVYVALPPLSGTSLAAAKAPVPTPARAQDRRMDNGLTQLRLSEEGFVEQWVSEGQTMALSGPVGQLMLYADKAGSFEAWDIDRHALALGEACRAPAEITPFDEDGVRAGYRVRRPIGKKSFATVEFALESGDPLLHITVDLNWHESECLLKLLIPTRYAATHARFGIPFGSVLRPQLACGLAAEAMWEVPFNRHLEVFDEGEREGLMVLSEAKYGALVRDGVVGVSLVRSPRVNGFDYFAIAWPPHLTRLKVPSKYSDIGAHRISLALGRYDIGAPRACQPAALAETQFTPPVRYRGKPVTSPVAAIAGGETLLPAWSVPVDENTWLLRLHEVAGRRGVCAFTLSQGWKLRPAAFDGRALPTAEDANAVAFTPYQILTLRLERSLN